MSDDSAPWARFDDLVSGSVEVFPRAERIVAAQRPDDVPAVLDEVDRSTNDGAWAFGFVSYEAASGLDPLLRTHAPIDGLPCAWFALTRAPLGVPGLGHVGHPRTRNSWSVAWDAEQHARAVREVHDHIAAGETYQCNVTSRYTAQIPQDPFGLYQEMALGQRGAYNAYLDIGRFAVGSASPELFFETRDDIVTMRPMKGTAARGRTEVEDAELVDRLRRSAKERAENIMIVDLVRNDLARIAVPGTVVVPRLLHAERYETVHQLTSDVSARLRPGTGLTDIFRALFPCGSVTGAPKGRTMELIRTVEDGPRGVYCGAIGVIAPPGHRYRARFSVAIRTVVSDRESGAAVYGAGGGITWSSRAADEYAELAAKATVLDADPRPFTLIETMRHETGGGLRSLDAHLERLASSARYFGFAFDQQNAVGELRRRVPPSLDSRVTLICHRDGRVDIEVSELPARPEGPVRLAVDDIPIETSSCWSRHKTSRRRAYDERLARHRSEDTVVVNDRGEVMGSCTANIAVLLDGHWCTPPLDSGCIPGIERARLVATGKLHERQLHVTDLACATEVALVSSLKGWRPAVLTGDSASARTTVRFGSDTHYSKWSLR